MCNEITTILCGIVILEVNKFLESTSILYILLKFTIFSFLGCKPPKIIFFEFFFHIQDSFVIIFEKNGFYPDFEDGPQKMCHTSYP